MNIDWRIVESKKIVKLRLLTLNQLKLIQILMRKVNCKILRKKTKKIKRRKRRKKIKKIKKNLKVTWMNETHQSERLI